MAYKKLADLMRKLHRRTANGVTDWEETATKGVYQTSLSDYSVWISTIPSKDIEGDDDYVDIQIKIFDDEGSEIEGFIDPDLKPFAKEEGEEEYFYYHIMKETYETARRLALGTERAVNDILSELDDDSPF